MAQENQIQEVFERFVDEIPGFIAVSLVDLDSGMTLATRSVRPDFDLSVASAYNSEIVKAKLKAIRALGLKGGLEDMLLTLSDQIHLIRIVSATSFLYLAADRASANLAIVRNVVNKHASGLE